MPLSRPRCFVEVMLYAGKPWQMQVIVVHPRSVGVERGMHRCGGIRDHPERLASRGAVHQSLQSTRSTARRWK